MKKMVLFVSALMVAFTSLQAEEVKFISGGPLEFPEQFTATYDTLNLSRLLSDADTYFYPDSIARGEGNYLTSYSIDPFEFTFFQQVADWGGFLGESWAGFIYSNKTDVTTPGYSNQYSAITGGGTDGAGKTYMIGFEDVYSEVELDFTFADKQERIVYGGYITNTTWDYLAIKDGNGPSNKFKAGDWFKLTATGYSAIGNEVASESFYLADFRDGKSEIVNNWQWFDLSKLGKVASVKFTLSSSDIGDWGMNTPAYFCMDKLFAEKQTSSVNLQKRTNIKVYPTVTTGSIAISTEERSNIYIADLYGKILRTISSSGFTTTVDLSEYPSNIYLVKVGNEVVKIVKQ